jgi:hypothetical protein
MAFVCFVVEVPASGIADLNAKLQRPTNASQAVNQASTLMAALAGGVVDGSVQVTTRDSDRVQVHNNNHTILNNQEKICTINY